MDEKDKRLASTAIMEFLDWVECSTPKNDNEYLCGVKFGLMIAQQIAGEVDRNA